MNKDYSAIEELSLYVSKLSIRQRAYKHIFDLMNKLDSLDQLLEEGYTKDDIAFALKKNIKLEHHYCPVCNSEIHVYNLSRYPKTCSVSCGIINSQKLRKQLSQKRYGVDNPSQLQSYKDKYRNTMMKRYGGYTFQSKELLAKVSKTNLQRYGVEVSGANKVLHKKNVETCLQRYGVTHTSKLKENRAKARATNLRLHGSENYNNMEKIKRTCLERYGVEIATQCRDVRIKEQTRYKYNGMNFDSSWEIAYYIWLKDHNIDFEYQPDCAIEYTYRRKAHYYHPDFRVNGELIEIKGDHYFNKSGSRMICPYDKKLNGKFNAKYKCMLENNVKILRGKDMKPYLVYINETYGTIYLSQFKRNK